MFKQFMTLLSLLFIANIATHADEVMQSPQEHEVSTAQINEEQVAEESTENHQDDAGRQAHDGAENVQPDTVATEESNEENSGTQEPQATEQETYQDPEQHKQANLDAVNEELERGPETQAPSHIQDMEAQDNIQQEVVQQEIASQDAAAPAELPSQDEIEARQAEESELQEVGAGEEPTINE